MNLSEMNFLNGKKYSNFESELKKASSRDAGGNSRKRWSN